MSAVASPLIHPLLDGRAAIVRRARPEDREAYVAAVDSLSPQTRYQRFFRPVKHLAERDVDRLMDLDETRQVVWLAVDSEDGRGLGVARYALVDPGTADVAVTTMDRYHGQGLGGALLDQVIASAREHELSELVADSLADNHNIAVLLRSRGFHASAFGPGVISWRMAL